MVFLLFAALSRMIVDVSRIIFTFYTILCIGPLRSFSLQLQEVVSAACLDGGFGSAEMGGMPDDWY